MKKYLYVVWTVLLIVLIVAYFTKPTYNDCFLKISHDLNAIGRPVGVYYSYDKVGQSMGELHSTLVIKDRVFYRDVYYPINGKKRKIAIAAFTKIFKIN